MDLSNRSKLKILILERRYKNLFHLLSLILVIFSFSMAFVTQYGHWFAFSLLAVIFENWMLDRKKGLLFAVSIPLGSSILMLIQGKSVEIIVRDNLMFMFICFIVGFTVGYLSELNRKLLDAHNEIRDLKRIIPICSHCKKIRDDKGYWEQVEDYIMRNHSVSMSHGICPECKESYYKAFMKERADGSEADSREYSGS